MLFLILFVPMLAFSQTTETGSTIEPFNGELHAVITSVDSVEVGKRILFHSDESEYDPSKEVNYTWDLGDGTIINGEEIVHMYQESGRYVVRLTLEQNDEKEIKETFIYVYERIIALISNTTKEQERKMRFIDEGRKSGVFIKLIEDIQESGAATEENLIKKMSENIELLKKTDMFIVWPNNTLDFSILTNFYRDMEEKKIDYSKKTFIFITENDIESVANFSQSIFDIIKPDQIIITRKQALPSLFITKTHNEFIEELEKQLLDFSIVNEQSGRHVILNVLSSLITFLLQKGIPSSTIILILILPIIVTIVGFCRQVIGFTTFGVYTPSIIAISLIALGLKFGLIILLTIVITGTLIRMLLNRFRLLYIPKVAIILTISALVIFFLMVAGAWFEIAEVTTIAVFPMLIMTTLGEKFLALQSGKGLKSALTAILETTIVSLLCYFIVTWQALQTAVISYPGWMFTFVIIINIVMGKFTGLRLSEYIRFREVFEHMEE